MSLLVDYLEEEGFIRHCSVTTCSEYYQGQGIRIRVSDHRGHSTNNDLDIQKVKNNKNEYLIYIKNYPYPITVKGINDVRQAIKWYIIFNNLHNTQDNFKKSTSPTKKKTTAPKKTPSKSNKSSIEQIAVTVPNIQPKIVGQIELAEDNKIRFKDNTKPIDCNNYSDIPEIVNKIDIASWEGIRSSWKIMPTRKDFYKGVSGGIKCIDKVKDYPTKKIKSWKDDASNVGTLASYVKAVIGVKLSNIVLTKSSREILYESIGSGKFLNFLELITFLIFTYEKLKKTNFTQETFTSSSITNDIQIIRDQVLKVIREPEVEIDSPTSYSVTKVSDDKVVVINQSDVEVISPLCSDNEKDKLLEVPITSRGVAWKTKMQVFIMRDFIKYYSFSALVKDYIWKTIFKDSRLTKYQDFYDTLSKCSEQKFSLESIKSNFEKLMSRLEKENK